MKRLAALLLALALSLNGRGNTVETAPSAQAQSPAPAVKPPITVSQPKPELPERLDSIGDPTSLSPE